MKFPLLAREWSIVGRAARIGLVLITLGVAFIFIVCPAEDRYRLFADPIMLRPVIFPGALGSGAFIAWLSVVQEMRSGTWDGWLLLPRSRSSLAAAKIGVGALASTSVIAVPVVLLWLLLGAWGSIGGPSISLADLILRSVMTQGVIIALVTYLAVANAAQMARAAHVAFVAPLGGSLFATMYFFGNNEGPHDVPVWLVEIGLVVACVVSAVSVVLSIQRWGRPLAATELWLRSLVTTPTTSVVVLFMALVVAEVSARTAERHPVSAHVPWTTVGVDRGGNIVTARQRELLAMYRFRTFDEIEEGRTHRLWPPAYTGRSFRIFQDRDRNTFSVYQNGTGALLGCLGRDGLRASGDCREFAEHVVVYEAFLLAQNEVLRLEDDGNLTSLAQGLVHGAVNMSTEDSVYGIAIGIDDGVIFVPDNGTDASPIVTGLITPSTSVRGIAIGGDYVAIELESATHSKLAVVRDGRITEEHVFEKHAPTTASEPSLRRRILGLAVGPLFGTIASRVPSAHTERERVPSSLGAFLLAAFATAVLVVVARRARDHARPWWILPSLVLGPGYAFACALVLWRRPRWARVVR